MGQVEMPKYYQNSVWALKIKDIVEEPNTEEFTISFEEEAYAPIKVTATFIRINQAVAGGYYVVVKNGDKTFIPAEIFEREFTKF